MQKKNEILFTIFCTYPQNAISPPPSPPPSLSLHRCSFLMMTETVKRNNVGLFYFRLHRLLRFLWILFYEQFIGAQVVSSHAQNRLIIVLFILIQNNIPKRCFAQNISKCSMNSSLNEYFDVYSHLGFKKYSKFRTVKMNKARSHQCASVFRIFTFIMCQIHKYEEHVLSNNQW